MGALTELKGSELGSERVMVERGPVRVFARAVKDHDPTYDGLDAAVPPTYPFSWSHFGSLGRSGSGGLPIEKLRGPGRMILHGEQEFVYHRPVVVGDVLVGNGTCVDAYERESKGKVMTFVVSETVWSNQKSGEPVVTERFNLIHRR